MNHFYTLLFTSILLIASSCNQPTEIDQNKNEVSTEVTAISVKDTTPKVTGIGGIFFYSENPKETNKWYGEQLGLTMDEYGSPFEFRNANNPDEINYLRWASHNEKSNYYSPSDKPFMINYRVQNIEGLVRNLRASGTTILDTIESYDYGKFVHIMDPFGNKIELWEPIDSVLTEIGSETTK